MSSTTPAAAQTALPFNLEEFCKANEREFRRLGGRVIDLNAGTPDTHKSSIFQCTSSIRARITPFLSFYILDFVDNDGSRIEGGLSGLVVIDTQLDPADAVMETVGKGKLELYFLHSARIYEIRLSGARQPLKTITFRSQVTTTVQCV